MLNSCKIPGGKDFVVLKKKRKKKADFDYGTLTCACAVYGGNNKACQRLWLKRSHKTDYNSNALLNYLRSSLCQHDKDVS